MKVGDKVIVTKEIHGHGFRIGQKIEIKEVHKSYYACADGDLWYLLTEQEFELCEE